MANLPEIRVKDGWLIRKQISVHLHELWSQGDKSLADDKDMDRIVGAYKKAWEPYEEKIVHAMCDVLELEFRQNIIDVYIAPWMRAFSDPMVIGVTYKPDVFVDILTHELLHRLLTDNKTQPYEYNHRAVWKKMFGNKHSFATLVHIPVHAVHKYIMLDVLKEPKRLERDLESCKKHDAVEYTKAWDYVETKGYKDIIELLRKDYTNGD